MVFSPPTAEFNASPDENRQAIADLNSYSGDPGPYMTGVPNEGNKQAAMAYLDSAQQMLTAAVNEDPRLAEVVQRVSMVIGMGLQNLDGAAGVPPGPPGLAPDEGVSSFSGLSGTGPENIPLDI